MQRVVSINLNGNAYQLEENGYNALFAFLDAVEAALKDDPNRSQTLAELEEKIAARCGGFLSPHKTVVTSPEIDRIIGELGPVYEQAAAGTNQSAGATGQTTSGTADATGNAASSGAGAKSGSTSGSGWHGPTTGPFAHRRLYQIREGSMISGVCMGLAEFLHIDVTIIRILFVLFALSTGGWGIIPYAVLMFVVPKVDTRAAAASAQGAGAPMPPHPWPWAAGWPWDKDGWPWDKHGWPWDQPAGHQARQAAQDVRAKAQEARATATEARAQARQARSDARDMRREARVDRWAARAAYHPGPSGWGMFGMVMCVAFAFFWLSMFTRGHFFFGWPFFWGFPHWVGILIFFMVMRMIFMPHRSRWYGYGYGPYAHPHYGWASMWNGLAWFALMIFVVWAAYYYIPGVHDFIRSFQAGYDYRYGL